MKSFTIASLVALMALSLSAVPGESAPIKDIAERVPIEIIKSLGNSSDLGPFEYTEYFPSTNVTLNVSSFGGGFEANATYKYYAPSLVQVVFDLILPGVTVEGEVVTADRTNNSTIRHAKLRSIAMGNLTLKVEAFYNSWTKSLVVKNEIKKGVPFFTQVLWLDCKPFTSECAQGEQKVTFYLAGTFPHEYNKRIQDILFEASPDIVKRIEEADDQPGRFAFVN